jgi:hypothetical protein
MHGNTSSRPLQDFVRSRHWNCGQSPAMATDKLPLLAQVLLVIA